MCREGRWTQTCRLSTAVGAVCFPRCGSERAGVTWQCWERTSRSEISTSFPIHLPPGGISQLLTGSSLLPALSPGLVCASPSPRLVLPLQWCWDLLPSCAGMGPCPPHCHPAGAPAGQSRACGVHGGGFGRAALPSHAGPGRLVIFSNRCY